MKAILDTDGRILAAAERLGDPDAMDLPVDYREFVASMKANVDYRWDGAKLVEVAAIASQESPTELEALKVRVVLAEVAIALIKKRLGM